METIESSEYVTIGELVRLTGVRYSTLKFYTKENMIPFEQAEENLTRRYKRVETINRIALIKQLKSEGYLISQIKETLSQPNAEDSMILETSRLWLRKMKQSDFSSLCKHLQDKEVMYAYEHAFSDAEIQEGIDKQLQRYQKDGFGIWAVILKENEELIGQCGLSMQPCGADREVLEIGYIFQKEYWHKGYATEAAVACREYAFEKLNADEVFSIIRDTNIASQNVAKRNGMSIQGMFIKHYYGVDMPHYIFSVKRIEVITAHKINAKVRLMQKSDYECLPEFLYQAIYISEGAERPPRDVIKVPEINIYIKDFGTQSGDLGVVAEQNGQVIGGAWTRIIPAYGHIDKETPELAISVLPEFRSYGIGSKLMKKLFKVLRENGYKQTSLSVQKDNPAVRFYKRLGYEILDERLDHAGHGDYLMIKEL